MIAGLELLLAQPGGNVMTLLVIGAAIVGGCIFLVMLFILFAFFNNWFQAYMNNADVGWTDLISMSFMGVPADSIVQAKIMVSKAGFSMKEVSTRRLEAHYLAGGRVLDVCMALIRARRADIPLDFDRAAAIDLAGRNVLEAVMTSTTPKVIDCPDPARGKKFLSAVARNGVELLVRARVTVRTNLDQLIGGATEDTIIARVGEGIITSIGSSEKHQDVMENPDRISKAVLDRGLDAQTAFEIVSIDIADIDVGENIGARLQADQAEADTRVARARAEQRRADAVAHEQEMKAATAMNRAKVIDAESLVPMSMAQAFRRGLNHSDPSQNTAASRGDAR